MKKKILSLLLVLTMVFSMISCGNSNEETSDKNAEAKTPSLSALFEKMEGIEAKTADVTMDIDLSGLADQTTFPFSKIGIKLSVVSDGSDGTKESMEIGYRLDDDTDFATLTTLIVDNTTIYIDCGTLKNELSNMITKLNLTMYSMYLGVIPDGYLKIDQDTLMDYIAGQGVDVDMSEISDTAQAEVLQKVILAVVKTVSNTVEDATKDVTPALISGTDDDIKITVTKDNLGATIDAISALDLAAKYDEVVTAVKAVEGADSYATDIQNEKDTVVSGIKDGLQEVKDELENFTTFDITCNFAVTGDEGSRVIKYTYDANMENSDEKVVFSISMTAGEAVSDDKTITVPTDALDFIDFISQLSGAVTY